MGHIPYVDPNQNWESEKKRIEQLSCWGSLAGKNSISVDGKAWHFQSIWLSAAFAHPTKFSLQELRVRVFMRIIRVGGGTVGPRGYERLFGGSSFIKDHGKDFSDYPQIKIKAGGYVSSAVGAYQVMGYTWSDANYIKIRSRLRIQDFSPESQDRFGVVLLRYATKGNALKMIVDDKIKESIESCSWIWASLPPSRYGQPIETMEEALENYEKFLKEEKSGETDLHIKSGFLEEFGY